MCKITCRIVRDGSTIFVSEKRGITPLVEFIESGCDAKGCVAYDKIVGKAAALLYAHMQVAEVHADVLSASGAAVFRRFDIAFDCKTTTESIINRAGTGLCPMELAVASIDNPSEAFSVLRAKLNGDS